MLRTGLALLVVALVLMCSAAPVFAHEVIYDFPLNSDPGWAIVGGWSYGHASDTGVYDAVTAAHTGTDWYSHKPDSSPTVHDGAYLSDMADEDTLTAGAIDCTGLHNVQLRFWRRLGMALGDVATVRVSNNGTDWTTVWQDEGGIITDLVWTQVEYDISAVADDQPTVYVQWALGPTDGTCQCWGWDIDDVQILVDPLPDLVYSFPLATDPGWSLTGSWAFGVPGGAGTDPDSAHTGSNVFGYNLAGNYENSMSEQRLTTPALNCSDVTHTTLSFWRWLGVAWYDDHARLQVSKNNATWTTIWENAGFMADTSWVQCTYDISAIADGEPTVYIRWVMGPTDTSYTYGGWNIDDIEIWGHSGGTGAVPRLRQVLVWVPYADWDEEYPYSLDSLDYTDSAVNYYRQVVAESYTLDPAVLAQQLRGKDVFFVPEPENATSAQLIAAGTAFADVLQDFVYNGGTVIVCGEVVYAPYSQDRGGFMDATGLMSVTQQGWGSTGGTLTVAEPSHFVATGVGATFLAPNATYLYSVGPESIPIVIDGAGHTVAAVRDYGFGAAVLVGFDYYLTNGDATRVLGNAAAYPATTKLAYMWDSDADKHMAREALSRLRVHWYYYTDTATADEWETDFDWADWDLYVVDAPDNQATDSWAALIDEIGAGKKVLMQTYDLADMPDLQAAFGISAADGVVDVPPLYNWDDSSALFHRPNEVSALTNWEDNWPISAELLTTAADGEALAGFTASPTAGQAAIVLGNDGRTLYDGYLWDEGNQDADYDGVDDTVELLMNQMAMLLRRPEAHFAASWSGTYGPLPVGFTDQSTGVIEWWSWDFGDGGTSTEQDPGHTYTSVGSFTVSLVVSNSYNHDTETKLDLIVVTALPPVADFSASPTLGYVPLEVTFTDLSANDPTEWAWDFGDPGSGGSNTSDVQNPTHSYANTGTFTVSLTATNVAGSDTKTETDYIRVVAAAAAAFSATPTSGTPPLTVDFTDESTGTIESWAWDFGDTGTSDLQDPSHEYTDAGSYDVSLTVTNAMGSDTETKPGYIRVGSLVAAAFSASTTAGIVPLAVTFTDHSTGSPTEWAWDFGDGATSTVQNPSHTYGDPGYYTVILTASNGVIEDVETRPGCIAAGFIDTPADSWAFYYILACASADVVQGYWDNSYKPLNAVNRSQMATYIARALAGGDEYVPDPTVSEPSFTDVDAGHWAYRYVEYAKDQEIVQGYPDGSYKPDAEVNRGQMAVYIARSVADPLGDTGVPDAPAGDPTFADVTAENEWAWCHKYVEYIATLDPPVTTGYPDGMYHPERVVTRDQMAVYVQRAFDLPIYAPSP